MRPDVLQKPHIVRALGTRALVISSMACEVVRFGLADVL
jgi:hypothetical protein